VTLEYTPSTKFYIDDKLAGNPWITKLHFPVHCISKSETIDRISGWRFVNSYKYHHGYYDHPEREFRGFGMVEETDSEHFEHWAKGNASNIVDETLHQEPVVTKTWFHTGAFLGRDKILNQFAKEYWYEEMIRQGFAVVNHEVQLPDAQLVLSPGIPDLAIKHLSAQEWREALRSCKSMSLRSEVFAHDAPLVGATPDQLKKQLTPYSVASHNCLIELLQPQGKNKHAVFIVKEREAITYNYERDTADPRISHNLNISLDEYGNVLESAAVVYPRVLADGSLPLATQTEQSKTVINYKQNQFTNDVIGDDVYRLRLQSEAKTYELKGVSKAGSYYMVKDFTDILTDPKSSTALYYELDKPLVAGKAQRRLIEHIRINYRSNHLTGKLVLHQLDSLALPFESYQLAYTPELITDIFGAKVDAALMTEGKFTNIEGDLNWWIRSGTTQFIEGAETEADAKNRFYVPVSYIDPFGSTTRIKYYSNYFLFVEETEDALKNKSKVDIFNFRTLLPQRMRDINNNLSEAISDELGLVKAMVLMGKGNEADDLTGLSEFTDPAETALINQFFNVPDTRDGIDNTVLLKDKANRLLQHATARFVYDFDSYINTGKPAVVASILREEHFKKNNNSPVQLSFEYSNGLEKVIMKKVQAAPGIAKKVVVYPDDTYSIVDFDTSSLDPEQLRWIGNGRTILNNKGNAVKQYEPYFSVTHRYESLKELVESGVTPVMYYDAMGRMIKTKMPDGTLSRTEFDSWKQIIFDANDTVLDAECAWYINRVSRLIDAELIAEGKDPAREMVAAEKTFKHANTPGIMHFDALGRPVLSVEHNRNVITNSDEYYRTKVKLDIEGNMRSVTDAREMPENGNAGNTTIQYKYDMLGNPVYRNSLDAGQRWLLSNILGNQLRTWDERNHEFQYFYDTAHRPLISKIIGGDSVVPLDNIFDRVIYGEDLLLPNRTNEAALQLTNILGKPLKHFDTGGVILTPEYNFKGQPSLTTRNLFKDYKSVANWTDANLLTDLEVDDFTFTVETDALGRISKQTTADESIITPLYNETGLLKGGSVKHVNPDLTTSYIKDIDYNEKGQRIKIIYGNDVISKFDYDKETFQLNHVETKRQNNDPLQDWYYTFDPTGNITHIEDQNIPVVFYNNQKISGLSEFTYDALYRLVEATGRENNAALAFNKDDNWNDSSFMQQINPGDPMAVRNYTQDYLYDEVGNLKQMAHQAVGNNWTRNYDYEKNSNRLKNTQVGAETYTYEYHPQHGFILLMPHLPEMGWNFREELIKTVRQKVNPSNGTPETTWYQYDRQGQRIRKITENSSGAGANPTKKEERIYISGYETYRTYNAIIINFERESLSLIDEGHRFVLVETVKQNASPNPLPSEVVESRQTRYQLHNHLGSASLELDTTALVISYEEYHPFGTTAYQANNATIKASSKRYRYTGMERDEETGLEYHNARYYLSWLGRWVNTDPMGIKGGINLYRYCKNNPVIKLDQKGTDDKKWTSTIGPDGNPVYQSVGDQATTDLGKVGKKVGGVLLDSDEVKKLKKLTLDPKLAELKTSLGNDWDKNKVALIIGGGLILIPTAAVLGALAVKNPKLDVPIVGDFYPRQGAFGLASLGTGALSEYLTNDRIKIGLGYENKSGTDLYSFELTLKGPKVPDDKTKPADDKKTPEKTDPNALGVTAQTPQQKEEDKVRKEIAAPGSVTLSGKISGTGNQGEGSLKIEKPTDIGRLSFSPTLKVGPTGNTSFATNLSVTSLVAGTRFQVTGSLFLNAPAATGSPFDVKYDTAKNTATVTTTPPLAGSGFYVGVVGSF